MTFAKNALAALLALAALAPLPAWARSAWTIDPARTHIRFTIDATGWPRTLGEFHKFDGRISVDFDHPEQSRVDFTVRSGSVDVGSSAFSAYVAGVAFLNAEKFADIAFKSTSVAKLNDHQVRVSGELTLLGVTQALDVDVEVKQGAGKLEFTAHTHIDRLGFGMNSGYPVISRQVDLDITSAAGVS